MIADQDAALAALGVNDTTLTSAQRSQLDNLGYLVIEDVIGEDDRLAMRAAIDFLFAQQEREGMDGPSDGQSEMIFSAIFKDPAFRACTEVAAVWAAARHVLGHDAQLAGGNGNVRSGQPGNGLQGIHSDMPPVGATGPFDALQVCFALHPVSPDNGAARLVPGSHKFGAHAHDVLENSLAPHPGQIQFDLPAGAVAMFNANCWHGGMTNWSGERRYALFAGVGRWRPESAPKTAQGAGWENFSDAVKYLSRAVVPDSEQASSSPSARHHMPCWCCGIRRTCTPTPEVGQMDRLVDGRPNVYAMEIATYGFSAGPIV
jgi:hypothetical protein